MINKKNLDLKAQIPRENHGQEEVQLPSLQYKSLTPTYDYIAQLSSEIENLQQRNRSLENRLSELTTSLNGKNHNKHNKKTFLSFKLHEIQFSEKLKARDNEISNILQAFEKQRFSKNPTFIKYTIKSGKPMNSDLITKSLLVSNPQRAFFSKDDIFKENEELRSLISDQEETLRLLNAKLDLFHHNRDKSRVTYAKNLLTKRELAFSEAIPSEKRELQTEKKVLQQELQRLIKARKELNLTHERHTLSQNQVINKKPTIISLRRHTIFYLNPQQKKNLGFSGKIQQKVNSPVSIKKEVKSIYKEKPKYIQNDNPNQFAKPKKMQNINDCQKESEIVSANKYKSSNQNINITNKDENITKKDENVAEKDENVANKDEVSSIQSVNSSKINDDLSDYSSSHSSDDCTVWNKKW